MLNFLKATCRWCCIVTGVCGAGWVAINIIVPTNSMVYAAPPHSAAATAVFINIQRTKYIKTMVFKFDGKKTINEIFSSILSAEAKLKRRKKKQRELQP